ncbi:MAG: phosphopantetheine-binding protein [Phycisphaerae bacterium]
MSLEHELKVAILEELNVDEVRPEDLNDNDPLFGEGLGLDSLDAVELVLLLKKRYQVEIKDMDEAREPFSSIAALANYIRARQGTSRVAADGGRVETQPSTSG